VLLQFPLYGGIALLLTDVAGANGVTLAQRLSALFVQVASRDSFALVMGAYSAVLGFFVPSGGGKWIIEAPYVMQAANELQMHLGWAVQVYNAAEALPNLVNPFWMLPLLGVLGLKARDIVGFTFVQLAGACAPGAGVAVAAGDDAGIRAAGDGVGGRPGSTGGSPSPAAARLPAAWRRLDSRAGGRDPAGGDDADLVQDAHRDREHQLRDHVRRRDDRGDDEDADDGVARAIPSAAAA
jgi:hypothetical protein